MWESAESISYNVHPPLLRRFGVGRKLKLGPWFRGPLRVLAGMRFLRGTALDVFGMSRHRRLERSLVGWYKDLVRRVMERMDDGNVEAAVEVVALAGQIRGFESVKERSVEAVKKAAAEKLAGLGKPELVRVG
jgi:indolepyruvate ferredoxin oxidoreductase